MDSPQDSSAFSQQVLKPYPGAGTVLASQREWREKSVCPLSKSRGLAPESNCLLTLCALSPGCQPPGPQLPLVVTRACFSLPPPWSRSHRRRVTGKLFPSNPHDASSFPLLSVSLISLQTSCLCPLQSPFCEDFLVPCL